MLGDGNILVIDGHGLGRSLSSSILESQSDVRLIFISNYSDHNLVQIDGALCIEIMSPSDIGGIVDHHRPRIIVDLSEFDSSNWTHVPDVIIHTSLMGSRAALCSIGISFSHVYGPGIPSPMEHMVHSALEHEIIPIQGDGSTSRDWIHAGDCIRALHRILRRGSHSSHYSICSGSMISDRDLARRILRNLDLPLSMVDYDQDLGISEIPPMDHTSTARLGWRPEVDLDSGIEAVIKALSDRS